jgi:hypothetical protein
MRFDNFRIEFAARNSRELARAGVRCHAITLRSFEFCPFEFVSDFEIRISNLRSGSAAEIVHVHFVYSDNSI